MKKITLLVFIYSINCFSQVTSELCELKAKDLGSQSGIPQSIPSDCTNLIKSNQSLYNFDSTQAGDIKVYGHKNMLLTEIYQPNENGDLVLNTHYTSGEKSKLTNILAVEINTGDQRSYVLNEENGQYSVYSYFYSDGGNNVPARKLITTQIINATNIKVDNSSSLLYVVSSQEGWVKVFNMHADPDGPRDENKLDMLKSLFGINSELTSPIDITFTSSEVFILDESKILVFNASDNGNVTPKRIIQGFNTNLDNSKDIEISQDGQSIVVTKINNTQLTFPLAASGNVTPN